MSLRLLSALEFAPVTALPRLPLSMSASTASCSIRFSLRTMISGALSCMSLLRRLLRFMTRLYRSFKSLVANLPPSSCTMGRISGGMTGRTSIIIHSGLLPLCLKASTTSSLLTSFAFFWPPAVASSSRSLTESSSQSICCSRVLMASAPMPAAKSSSYFSRMSRYSRSESIWHFSSGVSPGSVTIYAPKYSTFSSILGVISSSRPILEGMPLKYQMWLTGAASSMWPMRSRLTLAFVTSTPQRSQILPL